MQGVEAITAEILAAAAAEASETVEKAEEFKAARLAELEERLAAQRTEKEELLRKEAESVVERRLTLASLEARMAGLGSKQAMISRAYALAYEKVRSLPDDDYRALFARLLAKVAEDGDKIAVAEADKSRLDQKWLDKVAASLGKKLSLSGPAPEVKYGIVVSGKISETDLSLDTLISELRTECESEVLAALFG